MKKLITLSTMALALVFTVTMAYGTQLTLPISWYVNDAGGIFFQDEDTWLTLKNNSSSTVTLTLDFYDNDAPTVIATTDTVVIGPKAAKAYYTGAPSFGGEATILGQPAFNMGAGADRGSIEIRFNAPGGETSARQVITGYQTIDIYSVGSSYGINFVYTD